MKDRNPNCVLTGTRLSALIPFLVVLITLGWRQEGLPQTPKQSGVASAHAPAPMDVDSKFEVATIKTSPAGATSSNIRLGGHHVYLENETIEEVVEFAYQVHGSEVIGGPAWFRTEHFDISGVPEVDASPTLQQLQHMLQDLLATRCRLRFHHEKRDIPVYVLSLDGGGAKLRPTKSSAEAAPTQTGGRQGDDRVRTFRNNTMADFVLGMQGFTDRPLVNATGLNGRYDFTLTWHPDDLAPGSGDTGPDLFAAVREQLGLNLKSARGPADVLVINTVRLPSED